jgi:hypothetical protein
MRNGISWMIRALGSSLVVLLALGSACVRADLIHTVDIADEQIGLGVCGNVHSVHVSDSKPGNGPNYCNSNAQSAFVPVAAAWNAFDNRSQGRPFRDSGTETHAVPEPGTLALLGIGLIGIGVARRRRNA